MKKLFVVLMLILSVISCRKDSETAVIQIDGMWAKYDDTELTRAFYQFVDGKYSYYTIDEDVLLRYSSIWGADVSDFDRYDFGNYSINGGRLMLNERNAGEVSVADDVLTIGDTRYMKIVAVRNGEKGASKIILETDNVTIRPDRCDKTVIYRIINLIPGHDRATVEYRDSPDWTMYPFVFLNQITVGGIENYSEMSRTAELVVSYPYAADEVITLTQSGRKE